MDFSTLAALPDERMDVLRGALLVARDEFPTLSLERETARIDELAEPLGSLSGIGAGDQAVLLAEHLFGVHGFRGNHDEYYDPKNSYLNAVLDRKLGIPITLSILYVEVARRAGVPASGVSFPRHFLVRIETETGEPLLVDPFGGGRVVGRGTLESWLERGPTPVRNLRARLSAASPGTILLRLLANLKGVYATRGDLSRLLVVISRMLELSPDSADDLRDRAFVAMRLGVPRVAEGDFRRYLDLCPEAGDVAEVRRLLVKLGGTTPAIH
ncbi:MAG TPA: tetratricopeptide repeat protein [Polyangiaceae bacterium]|nr:tetratricopeptide repeat protein [Polyangiaceae bacterium]